MEVVVQIVSSDNECSEKTLPGMGGSYLSRNDEVSDQKEVKKKRKRKSKSKDRSDEWEPSSCEEDIDCDSDSAEDQLTVLKEEGQFVVWCTQCETEAFRTCSVFQHKKLLCCAECGPADVKTYNIDVLPVWFDDIISFKRHAEQEHGVK